MREEIAVKGRAEPEVLEVRSTHHGPIVNEALGADEAEPLALRWLTLDEPTAFAGMFELHSIESGPELVAKLEGHTAPASNLIWADRHGSIGYKLIGRLPLRKGGCPDLPKPGWTGEFEWTGTIPYEELPETVDPESGLLVTANNRIVGDDYPHHITSEWYDGVRAQRIEDLLRERGARHRGLRGDAVRQPLDPGLEAARRLGRLQPHAQRERSAIERLRSWDGRLDPDSIAGTIYQAFLLRLAREVARAAIGDRDLCERWLDRADNGFTRHVTSPWRWHSHLMKLWEEGDEELIGRPWDELVLEALGGALDDLTDRFGTDPEGWRWGHVHEMEFPHPLGEANPLLRRLLNRRLEAGGAQETVSQIAYDPNDPYKAVWAPSWRMVADPTAPDRSRWQMFTGQSGHPASPHYDDLQADWLEGRTQPMAGEGPWRELDADPYRVGGMRRLSALVGLALLCVAGPADGQGHPLPGGRRFEGSCDLAGLPAGPATRGCACGSTAARSTSGRRPRASAAPPTRSGGGGRSCSTPGARARARARPCRAFSGAGPGAPGAGWLHRPRLRRLRHALGADDVGLVRLALPGAGGLHRRRQPRLLAAEPDAELGGRRGRPQAGT